MSLSDLTWPGLRPAVGDWEACGDAFLSREPLYDMAWADVDLAEKRRVTRIMHTTHIMRLSKANVPWSNLSALCRSACMGSLQGPPTLALQTWAEKNACMHVPALSLACVCDSQAPR